jgi:hypothetical protein
VVEPFRRVKALVSNASNVYAGAAREAAAVGETLGLRARASQLELDYPYGVVRQLFEPAIAQMEDPAPVFARASQVTLVGAAAPAATVERAGGAEAPALGASQIPRSSAPAASGRRGIRSCHL